MISFFFPGSPVHVALQAQRASWPEPRVFDPSVFFGVAWDRDFSWVLVKKIWWSSDLECQTYTCFFIQIYIYIFKYNYQYIHIKWYVHTYIQTVVLWRMEQISRLLDWHLSLLTFKVCQQEAHRSSRWWIFQGMHPQIVEVYRYNIRVSGFPIKGGMTIPHIATVGEST